MRPVVVAPPPRGLKLDPGAAPMLQWVAIADLVIDDGYQRELRGSNWTAIRRIAGRFRWSRFSPVLVAPVEGGKYALIDGQHRTHAAAMCGFEHVPAQIVQMTREEQAASFAAVNGMITHVTSVNVFKARVAEGEPAALEALEVARQAGCRLLQYIPSAASRRPGDIVGPKTFLALVAQRGPQAVTAALSALMSAEGYRDDGDIWVAKTLEPLVLGITANKAFLTSPGLVAALERMDFWDMHTAVHDEVRRRLRLGLPYEPKKVALKLRIIEHLARALLETREAAR